eukprot:COSAG01_NODE_40459_length_463_cov_1.131868_1_plen_51_part_01
MCEWAASDWSDSVRVYPAALEVQGGLQTPCAGCFCAAGATTDATSTHIQFA